jgi:integrase
MPGEGAIFPVVHHGQKRWRAQLSIGGRGARRYVTRTERTERAAKLALVELQRDAAGAKRTKVATSAYLAQWVRDARNIRPTTRKGYASVVTNHLVPTIGAIPLAALSPLDVESMLTTLAPRVSPKMLRNIHATLRRALGQAVRAGLVARNVASREFVDAPRVPSVEPKALSTAEVARVKKAAAGDPVEAIVIVALGTGLRQGELLGLAWEDVDLKGGRLVVRKELVYRAGKYWREEPKTERSKRTVPLSAEVVVAIEAHRERLIAAGFVPIATGPVFPSRAGREVSGSWVTHRFYAILARAKVDRVPFKNLRTTFASRLFEAGVSDRLIADLMGHTRTKTTQRHYIATTPEQAVEAVARLRGRSPRQRRRLG